MLWLILFLPSVSAQGDVNCLERAWYPKNYEAKDLAWTVGGRVVYDVWDASKRWQLVGGPIKETPAAAAWREDVRACGYTLPWPDKVG